MTRCPGSYETARRTGKRFLKELYPDFPLKAIAKPAGRSGMRLAHEECEHDEAKYIILTSGVKHERWKNPVVDGFGEIVSDKLIKFKRRTSQQWRFRKDGGEWVISC